MIFPDSFISCWILSLWFLAKLWRSLAQNYEDTRCPSCLAEPDTQAHSLECSVIKQMTVVKGDYLDIFQEDVPNDISNTLLRISKIREEIFNWVSERGPCALSWPTGKMLRICTIYLLYMSDIGLNIYIYITQFSFNCCW